MSLDTVARAQREPDTAQPFADLGLKADEYQRIRQILGRRPTSSELAMYSVMWSEHCSYKSSKVHLRQFGEKAPPSQALMVGIGENAGVVDIGDGWAVTFKVESHNHPSYVEPYQGAATGVGGIVRDIMSMGARPIAVMDALRFGPLDAPDTRRVLPGVVAGIGGYGNCLGLPNIGGEVVFDPSYLGNPLVNALCIGAMRHEDIHRASATGVGNLVVLYGARTGGDGIGGVSVLASETFTEGGPAKRPSVQVGDPFMEKLLIEATLDVLHAGLVEGIQDLGGAGISCATSELASNGTGGMHVWLDRVLLRDPSLRPEEILMSESQERMCAIVRPDNLDAFLAHCARWEVEAAVVGEVNDSGRLTVDWHGERIVDVPPRSVAHEGPVYERPFQRPAWQDQLQADGSDRLARPSVGNDLRGTLIELLGSANLASKAWVTAQYDRYVLGNTVLAQPEDAGMVRVDERTGRGVAVSTDCNGRFAKLDPYQGARLALAESYRNVCVTGATPIAVTNCLNFGSPEDPGVMWQFAEAVRGLADGCLELGIPVTGGNVSFYNQTGDVAILPTPIVGVLGVIEDVRRRVTCDWGTDEARIYLLGTTHDEFGGSQWAHHVHGHLGGLPPRIDLEVEQRLGRILVGAATAGMLIAAHDVSDGGVAASLVEMALRADAGARCQVPVGMDPFVFLFSESASRAIVVPNPQTEAEFLDMCQAAGLPATRIGEVSPGPDGRLLRIEGLFEVSLDELKQVHEGTFPRVLDDPASA